MVLHVFLALFNGMVIGTSRAINGRLSTTVGPLQASLWNHGVGFAFLSVVLVAFGSWSFAPASWPWLAYLGGCFGALFVAVSSYVFPRLGAMNAALVVISGQMISAVLIDAASKSIGPTFGQCLGVVLIITGIALTQLRSKGSPR